MKIFDIVSQRTLSKESMLSLTLYPISELSLISTKSCCAPNDNSYFEFTSKLEEGIKFGGFEFYWPLFVSSSKKLTAKITASFIVACDLWDTLDQVEVFHKKYSAVKNLIEPGLLYWTKEETEKFLSQSTVVPFIDAPLETFASVDEFKDFIKKTDKPIVIGCESEAIANRLKEILEEHDIPIAVQSSFPKDFKNHRLVATVFATQQGFETPEYLLISDQQILGKNYFGSKQQRKANYNFF